MKKLLSLTLISAAILAVSCGGGHNITGSIKGPGETVIIYASDMGNNNQIDTVRMNNGKFTYDIPEIMSDPVFISMTLESDIYLRQNGGYYVQGGKGIKLVMNHGERIRINGESGADGIHYRIKGSVMNYDMAIHEEELLPLYNKADSVEIVLDKAFGTPDYEGKDAYLNGLFAERGKYFGEMNDLRKAYIRTHPDRELSALYAAKYAGPDSLEYYFALLEPSTMEGATLKPFVEAQRKWLAEYLAKKKQQDVIVEGAEAPAFSLADRNGNMVSLADIKSDYIVLDFWGSWCGYCIAGFPKMKEYYAKYKDKVEFVGIDCRDSHADWIAALDKHELPWTQLIEDPDDKMSVKYAVEGYPTKILIGPDRKIVSIYLGESEEFYRKLDELFK